MMWAFVPNKRLVFALITGKRKWICKFLDMPQPPLELVISNLRICPGTGSELHPQIVEQIRTEAPETRDKCKHLVLHPGDEAHKNLVERHLHLRRLFDEQRRLKVELDSLEAEIMVETDIYMMACDKYIAEDKQKVPPKDKGIPEWINSPEVEMSDPNAKGKCR